MIRAGLRSNKRQVLLPIGVGGWGHQKQLGCLVTKLYSTRLWNVFVRPLGSSSVRSSSVSFNSVARRPRIVTFECSSPSRTDTRSGLISVWKSGTGTPASYLTAELLGDSPAPRAEAADRQSTARTQIGITGKRVPAAPTRPLPRCDAPR